MRTALFVLALTAATSCSGDDGASRLPDAPPPPDAAIDAAPTCAPVTGAGTNHPGTISTVQTWTAAESPHNLPTDVSINAAVTVEACAVVRIGGDRSVTIRTGGSLTTMGKPGQPVTIERLDPTNSWAVISGGTMSFTYTDIKGGGDRLNTLIAIAGAIEVVAPTATPTPVIHVDHVTVSGSESNGFNLRDGGAFDSSSTALTVTGSAVAPFVTYARLAGSIPPGTYTGNTEDAIVIRGTGGPESIQENMTLHARGIPYRVGVNANAVLDVANNTAAPTLTIEPGVTIKFGAGATMRIDGSSGTTPAAGALVAVGTATQKITLTSAAPTPAAGDWYGLWLGRQPLANTRLDYVVVDYAGKASVSGSESCTPTGQTGPNDAGIRILGGEPLSAFITNTEIRNSARHGIDRGFRSDTKPSLIATNTFTNVPGCPQTLPRDISGACPATVTCP